MGVMVDKKTEKDKQLEQWILGNSIHNKNQDKCCPDFSCCNKKMSTPKNVRERFGKAVRDGDCKTVTEMLGMFLGQAAQTMNKNIYVAGLEVPKVEQ